MAMIHCGRCDAKYNSEAKWVYGRYAEGTSGVFHTYGRIPEGNCPICRKPPAPVVERYQGTCM